MTLRDLLETLCLARNQTAVIEAGGAWCFLPPVKVDEDQHRVQSKGGRMKKYTVLSVQNRQERVHIETDNYKEAQAVYMRLKSCNRGRVRINGGEMLPIHKADSVMLRKTEGGKRWITSNCITATW